MKIMHLYASPSAYSDEEGNRFYEDVKAAMKLHKTQYFSMIGDLNAKVEKKSIGMSSQDESAADLNTH